MKKSPKKLTLTRETLRGLETSQLAQADGGALPVASSGTFSYTVVREDCCVGCTR
jgi:hypothetical protein